MSPVPAVLRRGACASLAALAAGLPLLGGAATASAAPHRAAGTGIKPGLYDCWGYSVYGFEYGGTYQFVTPGRYGYGGLRKGNRILGKVDHGRYRLRGRNLIPTSGPMKRNHFYLFKKNSNEWILMNDNHTSTGEGCYLYVPKKH